MSGSVTECGGGNNGTFFLGAPEGRFRWRWRLKGKVGDLKRLICMS